MDCREWKDLSEGYDQFMKMAQTIAAPVTRCFAFDPIENQADNAKGLIMIPNVGNMVFYMSTMMNDFANEVLAEFSVIVRGDHRRNNQLYNTDRCRQIVSKALRSSKHLHLVNCLLAQSIYSGGILFR